MLSSRGSSPRFPRNNHDTQKIWRGRHRARLDRACRLRRRRGGSPSRRRPPAPSRCSPSAPRRAPRFRSPAVSPPGSRSTSRSASAGRSSSSPCRRGKRSARDRSWQRSTRVISAYGSTAPRPSTTRPRPTSSGCRRCTRRKRRPGRSWIKREPRETCPRRRSTTPKPTWTTRTCAPPFRPRLVRSSSRTFKTSRPSNRSSVWSASIRSRSRSTCRNRSSRGCAPRTRERETSWPDSRPRRTRGFRWS